MGTFHATDHGRDRKDEPKPETDLRLDPPDTLTLAQAAIWRHAVEHAPRGMLKEVDLSVFLGWVIAFQHETTRAAQARIEVMLRLRLTLSGRAMLGRPERAHQFVDIR